MKTMLFGAILLSFVFATGVQAQEKNDEVEITFAATSVVSRTPGLDGYQNVKNFMSGDTTLVVTQKSSRGQRKACLKMCYELYQKGIINYKSYVAAAKKLGLKPRKSKKR